MDESNRLLREWFNRIDAEELAAMKERREEEPSNLEFKRVTPNPKGEPAEEDKLHLKIAISGFANAAGGIVLWGVESKKQGDRVDRSRFQSLMPVANGERVAIRFHELTAMATQPAVNEVLHRAIPVEGGFVVKTFIPASDGGPHRTTETNGQYYRREADSFRAMQHHDIADMFGRRLRPRLEIYQSRLGPHSEYSTGRGCQAEFIVGLTNTGRGIARFPRIVLKAKVGEVFPHQYGLDGNGRTNLKLDAVAQGSNSIALTGGADIVIHPGQILEVTKLGLKPLHVNHERTCVLDYSICAEGMQTVDGELGFKEIDFASMSSAPI